jgi:hypothetical protein
MRRQASSPVPGALPLRCNFQFQQNELRWGGGAPTSYESEFYYQFGFGRTDTGTPRPCCWR